MKNRIPAPPKGNPAQRRPPFAAEREPFRTIGVRSAMLGVLERQAHCALPSQQRGHTRRGAARPPGSGFHPADSSADRRFSAASPLRRCAAGLPPRLYGALPSRSGATKI